MSLFSGCVLRCRCNETPGARYKEAHSSCRRDWGQRETRASLSIFKGTIKRDWASSIYLKYGAGRVLMLFSPPSYHGSSFLPHLFKTVSSFHYPPLSARLLPPGLDGGVPPCPLGTLVWLRRRGFCGHGIRQGQPTYEKQCRIHSPAQSKQRETLLLDLTERTTWMQTDPALQSGPPEWGVLFDLIPAMRPEPHAHTDFTGITRGCCLHWGYGTTKRGNPLRMPKVWIFPW